MTSLGPSGWTASRGSPRWARCSSGKRSSPLAATTTAAAVRSPTAPRPTMNTRSIGPRTRPPLSCFSLVVAGTPTASRRRRTTMLTVASWAMTTPIATTTSGTDQWAATVRSRAVGHSGNRSTAWTPSTATSEPVATAPKARPRAGPRRRPCLGSRARSEATTHAVSSVPRSTSSRNPQPGPGRRARTPTSSTSHPAPRHAVRRRLPTVSWDARPRSQTPSADSHTPTRTRLTRAPPQGCSSRPPPRRSSCEHRGRHRHPARTAGSPPTG